VAGGLKIRSVWDSAASLKHKGAEGSCHHKPNLPTQQSSFENYRYQSVVDLILNHYYASTSAVSLVLTNGHCHLYPASLYIV